MAQDRAEHGLTEPSTLCKVKSYRFPGETALVMDGKWTCFLLGRSRSGVIRESPLSQGPGDTEAAGPGIHLEKCCSWGLEQGAIALGRANQSFLKARTEDPDSEGQD